MYKIHRHNIIMKGGAQVEYIDKSIIEVIKENIIEYYKLKFPEKFKTLVEKDKIFKKIYDIIDEDKKSLNFAFEQKGIYSIYYIDPTDNLLHVANINSNYNNYNNQFEINIILNNSNGPSLPILIWDMDDL